eukprot:CAMPEP_0198236808 /NCGR_PEP_ID=MMETSP1446-20131203/2697_1 /TAXON_ID=1461542 ORGANISM="Unidentified sp, Strain CCMP2111" /NCGR_SAMPLE_ID=MMETSP1446 /ASSEMBLY_ACC=CAM_ASM_001112 /LENGTH=294 /DNA_ID=CAMNT_0043918747 /DNA_START=13 /DNA_END=897 /DNA_ORIENTATION=-
MGERKVLNKYFPPDFDPSKIPRRKKGEDDSKQIKVRMMLPFSMRCSTCGNYIYKGTKFNSRKEDVENETYLGIRILRFYLRCPRCAGEITVKTDPKNSDYVCELGASRNFEPHREQQRQEDDVKKKREEEEEGDAMRALENRTLDSKREMDILSALDEMKSINARNAKVDTDQVIAALRRSASEKNGDFDSDEQDEQALQDLVLRKSNFIKRLDDSDSKPKSDKLGSKPVPSKANPKKRAAAVSFIAAPISKPSFVKKAKPEAAPKDSPTREETKPATGLAGLVAYSSSSSDDE